MGKKVGHEKQLRNTYIILLQFKKSCYLTFKYTEVVLCSFNTTYTSNKYKVHADTKCCAKLALWQVTDHAYKNMSDTKKISNVNTEIFTTTFSYSEFFSLRNSLAEDPRVHWISFSELENFLLDLNIT